MSGAGKKAVRKISVPTSAVTFLMTHEGSIYENYIAVGLYLGENEDDGTKCTGVYRDVRRLLG